MSRDWNWVEASRSDGWVCPDGVPAKAHEYIAVGCLMRMAHHFARMRDALETIANRMPLTAEELEAKKEQDKLDAQRAEKRRVYLEKQRARNAAAKAKREAAKAAAAEQSRTTPGAAQ